MRRILHANDLDRCHGGLKNAPQGAVFQTKALGSDKHSKALQRVNAGGFFFSECLTRLCHVQHDRHISIRWEAQTHKKGAFPSAS